MYDRGYLLVLSYPKFGFYAQQRAKFVYPKNQAAWWYVVLI